MRIRLFKVAVAVAALVGFAACDSQGQQDEFAEDASARPSGFVRTEDGAEIITEDLDDWRTSPVYAGKVSVRPAFPNPVDVDDFVTVPFNVTAFGVVRAPLHLRMLRDGRLVNLASIERAADPGSYAFSFSAALAGRTGLHRVFIFDAAGELVSYGDVMVE